ncbi:MAG: toprim domain-containing protein [Candidatus Thermoplasmatota archaeon]
MGKKLHSKSYTQELIEELGVLLEELKALNKSIPVVVEGRKDELALRALGLKGEIIKLSSFSLPAFCEQLAEKCDKVVILTDWDRQGGALCRALKNYLLANGVKYNDKIRERLVKYARKEIKDVESLMAFLQNIHARAGRPQHS